MSRRLSGAWFKLVAQNGDHLGMLMVPEGVAKHLEGKEYAYTTAKQMKIDAYWPTLKSMQESVIVHQFHIAQAGWCSDNAVHIVGITPEEIDGEPGFAFLPNADYLLAKLQPKPEPVVVAPRPELPGPYLAAAREFSA